MELKLTVDIKDLITEIRTEFTSAQVKEFITDLIDEVKWYDGDFPETVIERIKEDHL